MRINGLAIAITIIGFGCLFYFVLNYDPLFNMTLPRTGLTSGPYRGQGILTALWGVFFCITLMLVSIRSRW